MITVPDTWTDVKRALKLGVKTPILKMRKSPLGAKIPTGKKIITKHGETPEDALAKYAPTTASKPERMLYGWLIKHNISFGYQTSVQGGRLPGGAILDFIIYERAQPIVIRIQSYWHEGAEVIYSDDIQLNMLQELGYVVEDIWEYMINTVPKLDRKMHEILYGAPKWQEIV